MLKLGEKTGPHKIVLREGVGTPGRKGFEPEAFVVMAPITGAMRRRAQRAARQLLGDVQDIGAVDIDTLFDVGEAASRELIRLGLVEWGGIGDADGTPLALTPDRDIRFATANTPDRPTGNIDLLLADETMLERLDADYVRPDALRRAEKNASSASPTGTGGAATRASATASKAAARKAKTSGAKSVRTSSTRSRRKPGKPRGTS